MILKKVNNNGKISYEEISRDEAKNYDREDLLFTGGDEECDLGSYIDNIVSNIVSSATVNKMEFSFINAHGKKDDRITKLMSFLDEDEASGIVDEIISGKIDYHSLDLITLMPFLEDDDADRLFEFVMQKPDIRDTLPAYAPFVSEDCLSHLVDRYIKDELDGVNIDSLYPFMSSEDIKRLFKHHLAKKD